MRQQEESLTPEAVLRRSNKLRAEIEEAKQGRSESVGARQAYITQLREKFNIGDIAGAKKKLQLLHDSITRRNKKITELYESLLEKYDL